MVGTEVHKQPFSTSERVVLLITRMLTATLLTAFVGALENWLYELFFAPDLYAAGNPLARGVFALGLSFPYILVGLLLLGLPIAYALHRLRAESALTYSIAGLVTGSLWGWIALGSQTAYGLLITAFYGIVCALFWWWLRPRG
ncbi:MAG TPA: hypothetical protein VF067_05395 [Sphingomicrobium sp.]